MKGRRHTTPHTRFAAALAVSIGCHAAALLAIGLGDRPLGPEGVPRLLAVAIVGGDGASGGDGAAAGDGAATDGGGGATVGDGAAATGDGVATDGDRAGTAEPSRHADSTRPAERALRRTPRVPSNATAAADPSASSAGEVSASSEASAASAAGEPEDAAADPRGAADEAALASGAAAGGAGSASGAGGRAAGSGGAGHGDLRAWCRDCPTPVYPARARRHGWQGTVDVELRVGRDGSVEHVEVGRSSGFALLDAAAVTVARQSRFWVSRGEELRGQLRYRFVLEEALSHRPL